MVKLIVWIVAIAFLNTYAQAEQNQAYPFSVTSVAEGGGFHVVAHNQGPSPVSVKLAILDGKNVAPDRPFPVYTVVPPYALALTLAQVHPRKAGMSYSYRIQDTWMRGDFNAKQGSDAVYRLPYPDGMAFRIAQAPGGPITTHTSPDSHFAVDIDMPEGAPVMAARDGVVIYTEANQKNGGESAGMLNKANEIQILHVDNTIAIYAHLAYAGVYVHPGEKVTAGEKIGLSGSTGYSSGPHLHFVVETVLLKNDGLSMVSLPVLFYVGNPPTLFSPQFGMDIPAQYTHPAQMVLPD
jgi:murein DD-endopeptidase MepM/ murein hydrolase activator NlpD